MSKTRKGKIKNRQLKYIVNSILRTVSHMRNVFKSHHFNKRV